MAETFDAIIGGGVIGYGQRKRAKWRSGARRNK